MLAFWNLFLPSVLGTSDSREYGYIGSLERWFVREYGVWLKGGL